MCRRGSKGQVWFTDFMISIMLFGTILVTYFFYTEHSVYSDDDTMEFALSEAKAISGYLVGTGYPSDWTAGNVTTVGLTDGNQRIDPDKLSSFSSWGYEERRSYIHTSKDYYFYLEYLNGTRFNELCADPYLDCSEWESAHTLAQNTRFVIYQGDVIRMVLYIYEI